MSASPSIKHASLGQIQGTKNPQLAHVDQYLGIQYATLANRFARGALIETPASPIDATQIGPLPVADPQNCANEHFLIQHALPFGEFKFSDTECLTLNVSVPAGVDTTKGPLPVVAFVHGGGFVTGSANWPQYDLAALVERSVKVGKPVIAVGINYRLGVFGFLNSSAMRDAGFFANNGLHDQKLALRWIQKHIAGFGGNPELVTFLGSSMGAASAFFHLQSPEPLFAHAVALGGNPLIQPLPLPVGDIAFSIVAGTLGLASSSPADQVQALLTMPAEELSAKLANVPIPTGALHDGDIVKSSPTYASVAEFGTSSADEAALLFPGANGCKKVVMGDCQLDGMIFELTALSHRPDNLAETLVKSLEVVLSADEATKGAAAALVKAYGIDASAADNRLPVLHFLNDILFAQGPKATAQAWSARNKTASNKGYLSHFNLPNPWDGPWKGYANHALDVVILLGNYNQFLSPGQLACAEHMTDDFLRLAYGEDPFPPYSGDADAVSMVYYADMQGDKDESKVVKEADLEATKRRAIVEEVAGGKTEVLDKMLTAFGLFMQGGPK